MVILLEVLRTRGVTNPGVPDQGNFATLNLAPNETRSFRSGADTVGEFVWRVWGRGFPLPATTISPRLRPDDRRGEFANRLRGGSERLEGVNVPTKSRPGVVRWSVSS